MSRTPTTAFLLSLSLLAAVAAAQPASWSVHPLPPVPGAISVEIKGIDATGPSDVWAVGWAEVQTPIPGNFNDHFNLVMHYDGTAGASCRCPRRRASAG